MQDILTTAATVVEIAIAVTCLLPLIAPRPSKRPAALPPATVEVEALPAATEPEVKPAPVADQDPWVAPAAPSISRPLYLLAPAKESPVTPDLNELGLRELRALARGKVKGFMKLSQKQLRARLREVLKSA